VWNITIVHILGIAAAILVSIGIVFYWFNYGRLELFKKELKEDVTPPEWIQKVYGFSSDYFS
jgi:hypothetical protein